ncbi:MAG: helix-turn-helix transcriptional regulator [Synergistaceae bacterium]|nr:helix-turn-helix transcriptional regulator [Synergistaceae bacterium]
MTFASRLVDLRKVKCKYNQEELARQIEISVDSIRRWEKGNQVPRADELQKLAVALNTSVAYLIGETDDPRPLLRLDGSQILDGSSVIAPEWAAALEEGAPPQKVQTLPVIENRSPVPGTEIFATLGVLIGQLHNDYARMTPADRSLVKDMLIRCMRIAFGNKWVDGFIGADEQHVG